MGVIRSAQGRHEDAHSLHERSVNFLHAYSRREVAFRNPGVLPPSQQSLHPGVVPRRSVSFLIFHTLLMLAQSDALLSELLEKCVGFFGGAEWFKSQAARAAWKLGRTLQAEGWDEHEEEAKQSLERAMRLRQELDPEDHRDEAELSDADWDKFVYYYHR